MWLNSSFGIFALSTVALTIIPFQYSSCAAARDRRETIRRLDFELINRMNRWLNFAGEPSVIERYQNDVPAYVNLLLRVPDSADPLVPMNGVHSDFLNRQLVSLVAEYQSLQASEADQQAARQIVIGVNAEVSSRARRPATPTPLPLYESAVSF